MRPLGLLLGIAPTLLTLALGGYRQREWRQSLAYAHAQSTPQGRLDNLRVAARRAESPFVAPRHRIDTLIELAAESAREGHPEAARDALATAADLAPPLFDTREARRRALRALAPLEAAARSEATANHRAQLASLDQELSTPRDEAANDALLVADAARAAGAYEEAAANYDLAHALWRQTPPSDLAVRATLGQARLALARADVKKADLHFSQALSEGLAGAGDAPVQCDALREARAVKRLLGRDAEAEALLERMGRECPGGQTTADAVARAELLISQAREALGRGEPAPNLGQAELTLLNAPPSHSGSVAEVWFELAQAQAQAGLPHEAVLSLDAALAEPAAAEAAWRDRALRLRGQSRLKALGAAGAPLAVADFREAREALPDGPSAPFLDLSLDLAEAQQQAGDLPAARQTLEEVAGAVRASRSPERIDRLNRLLGKSG